MASPTQRTGRGGSRLPVSFYRREVTQVARDLLGKVLLKDGVGGLIVETEAYHQSEPAAHSFCGPTARNRSTFLTGGHVYVYRIHRSVCVNLVCGPKHEGAAVLIRALIPTDGVETIAKRRAPQPERAWTNGPGKLCTALGITLDDDGTRDGQTIRVLSRKVQVPPRAIAAGPRIGISKAVDLPWRFLVRDPSALG